MRNVKRFLMLCALCHVVMVHSTDNNLEVDDVDTVIEDEITVKLSNDLLQSIERKFQVDLEKAVDMTLSKIKLLLNNGTTHIQDKLAEIEGMMVVIRNKNGNEVDKCLVHHQDDTSSLAERALHEMVVCGYALIGHDPAQAVNRVLGIKSMISQGIRPIHEQKREIYDLLKVCGHDHETLKKVIKCVISKSSHIKSAMMDITNNLLEGVVDLTKLMAHGAMHEACLIEVIRTAEDEALEIVKKVRSCARGTAEEGEKYIAENNATVLAIDRVKETDDNVSDIKDLFKEILADNNAKALEVVKFKEKLDGMEEGLGPDDNQVNNSTSETQ